MDPLAKLQNSYSVYQYTYNNPLAFNDPTGMVGESINSSGKETERSISRDANGTPTGVRIGYAKDSGTNSGYSTTTARTGSSGNCCPDVPDDLMYQLVTPVEDFIGDWLVIPLLPNDIEVKRIKEIAQLSGLDLSGFSDKEILSNITLQKDGGALTISATVSFMKNLVNLGYDAVYIVAVFAGGGPGALMAKGGGISYKIIKDSFLKSKGIDAHKLKTDFVGRNNISHYDLYEANKTNEIWIFKKKGKGAGMPTGVYLF